MVGVRSISTFMFAIFIFLGVPVSVWAKPGLRQEEPAYAPCTSDTVSKEKQERAIKSYSYRTEIEKKLPSMSLEELDQLLHTIDGNNPDLQPLIKKITEQVLKKIAQNPQPRQSNASTVVPNVLAQNNNTTSPMPSASTQVHIANQAEQQPGFFSTIWSGIKATLCFAGLHTYVYQPTGKYIVYPTYTYIKDKIFGSALTPPAPLVAGATEQMIKAHERAVKIHEGAVSAHQAELTKNATDRALSEKIANKIGTNKLPFLQEKTADFVYLSSKLLAFGAAVLAIRKASSAIGLTQACENFIYGDDFEKVANYNKAHQEYEQRIEQIRNARAQGAMSIRRIPAAPEMPVKAVFKTSVLPYALPLVVAFAEYALVMPYIDKAVLGLLT